MKWLRRGAGIAILIAIGIGAYFSFQPKPIDVDLAQVVRGPLEVTVDEDGKTRIKERYIVSSPVGGRLRRIEFREGDKVYASETVLASIQPSDPDLLDARALAQAKARVSASSSAVDRAKTRGQQIDVELEQARKELERVTKLIKTRAIAQSEFEKTDAQFRSLKQQKKSAEFEQDIAEFELELAKAALVRVLPPDPSDGNSEIAALADFEIRSPIDGVVLRVLQESSTIVTPGTPIVELGDQNDLEVVVDVLSTDAVKLTPGTRVYLEQWGGESRLTGVVRLIEPAAFEKISALGVEEQRVNIVVDFDKSDQLARLGDGYRVEAKMVIWRNDNVIKVPTSALFREANLWSVFAVDDGFARLKNVNVGHRNDQEAEVTSGLEEGQSIVLHPGDNLVDGKQIKARNGN